MLSSEDVVEVLEEAGAVIRNSHLVYTSGRHGSVYINKDAMYPHTDAVAELCERVALRFSVRGIEVVAAPAIGGVILSQWVASSLTFIDHHDVEVLAVYAEKEPDGSFAFRRGYDRLLAGRKVLVVEDVLTTGGSLRAVIEAVRRCGGTIAGVAALVNRGGVTAEQLGSPVPLLALATIELESYPEEDCPLCRAGVPINTEVGKGRDFLARQGGV
jgi:orotate phosphoribosyltransferase